MRYLFSALLAMTMVIGRNGYAENSNGTSDGCSEILRLGFKNITKSYGAQQSNYFKWKSYCGMDRSNWSESQSVNASVDVTGYGGVMQIIQRRSRKKS